ncbi:LysM peptidoglycan-binding domain-containing protein, partial [Patescibacteria group bacterium]|nr:LysM peptidoglycan-binding domain-containing protein [Patescibacteria group bacterium]
MPVVIVLGIITADLAFFRLAEQAPLPDAQFITEDLIGSLQDGAFLGTAGPATEIDHADTYEDFEGFILVERGSLSGDDSPFGEYQEREEELLTYKVKDGDTLSSIAANFGISVSEIKSANDKGTSLIKPGEELAILPVSKSSSSSTTNKTKEAIKTAEENYLIRP